MSSRVRLIIVAAVLVFSSVLSADDDTIKLTLKSSFQTGIIGKSELEIGAYHSATRKLFVVAGERPVIRILDISRPDAPALIREVDVSALGSAANSIAISGDLVAAAIEGRVKTDPGKAAFFSLSGGFLKDVTIGALPDMITFTPDGHYVITANEGEPNDRYTVDPAGSVSIIDLGKGIEALRQKDVLTLDFSMFEGKPLPQYVRIATPGEPLVKDFEPEYIAVNADSTKAWVSLQENNAIGEIDLTSKKIVSLFGLSYTDHSAPGNFLDASDKDDSFNLRSWPVRGLPMPDAIATYQVAGVNFLITANEGDPRDYSAWSEVARVENLKLDEESFPNAADLQKKEKLGRLKVTTTLGDEDKDGKYEYLYSFGSRSFSIYKEDGQKVYDSGEFFGKYLALNFPEKAKDLDGRSDDKGSEPEGLVIGKINERTIAFIGLERAGGVFVFDVSKPETPIFQCYLDAPMLPGENDSKPQESIGPEGLIFIPAADSPSGAPLLVVFYEYSGSMSIFEVVNPPGPKAK